MGTCKDVYREFVDECDVLEHTIAREFARFGLVVINTECYYDDHSRYFDFESASDLERAINLLQPIVEAFYSPLSEYAEVEKCDFVHQLRIAAWMLWPVAQYLLRTPTFEGVQTEVAIS